MYPLLNVPCIAIGLPTDTPALSACHESPVWDRNGDGVMGRYRHEL